MRKRRLCLLVDCVWNVMAHAQKPDLVFRRKGRVNLNRRGRQFSRLLAAEVCASAVVMVGTPSSVVVWSGVKGTGYPTPFASFPFTSPPVRHRVPSGFNWTLQTDVLNVMWMTQPSECITCPNFVRCRCALLIDYPDTQISVKIFSCLVGQESLCYQDSPQVSRREFLKRLCWQFKSTGTLCEGEC